MKKSKKFEIITLELPLDDILLAYKYCIDERMTFDQFVEKAIRERIEIEEKALKASKKKTKKTAGELPSS